MSHIVLWIEWWRSPMLLWSRWWYHIMMTSILLASSINFWLARILLNWSSSKADLIIIPLCLVAWSNKAVIDSRFTNDTMCWWNEYVWSIIDIYDKHNYCCCCCGFGCNFQTSRTDAETARQALRKSLVRFPSDVFVKTALNHSSSCVRSFDLICLGQDPISSRTIIGMINYGNII